jgi:hypothetical protein
MSPEDRGVPNVSLAARREGRATSGNAPCVKSRVAAL